VIKVRGSIWSSDFIVGVGAAGGTLRVRLPTNVKQYIRLQITSGASTTDASATSATLQVLV
jgi:hypothetical protein